MPSSATITAFYSFTANTVIKSAEHNTNYSTFRGHIIPVDPNTATAAATKTYDLGSSGYRWRGVHTEFTDFIFSTSTAVAVPTAGACRVYPDGLGFLQRKDPANIQHQILDTELVTAKGDLLVATANNTITRLAVGTDTQMLVADSTTATGLKYRALQITAWAAVSVTGSWTTNTTYTARRRQVGEDYEYDIFVSVSGAPTSAALTITLPDTIDTTKWSHGTNANNSIGECSIDDSGGAKYKGTVAYSSTTIVQPKLIVVNATYATLDVITATTPFTFASGDSIHVKLSVPIVGLTV